MSVQPSPLTTWGISIPLTGAGLPLWGNVISLSFVLSLLPSLFPFLISLRTQDINLGLLHHNNIKAYFLQCIILYIYFGLQIKAQFS